jgi:choline dehydrogenase-like flavoprotein
MMTQHYDIIIIGSGAGGATLANALADTGKSILILERGDPLPIEADNWSPKAVFIDRKYRTREQWLDKDGKTFIPNTHYWAGGNTSFYGAALMRMKKNDFEEVQHAGGISPKWPLSYAEMAPWYDKAEVAWEVHGARHIDPQDQPDDAPFPNPPLAHDPGVVELKAHFEDIGWHPAPLPLGIRRNDANPPAAPCIRCETCGGYPCKVLAKVDARTAALAPALKHPNVTLLTGQMVERIETDASGKIATGVVARTAGGEVTYTGDIIVTSCGAAPSAALWLKSKNAAHPNGLANGSDMVGRNYMFHATSAVIAIAADKFDSTFPKTLYVNDFYFGEPDGSYPYPMGQIQMLEYMSGQTVEGQLADIIPPSLIPDAFANYLASHMVAFLAMSEDLPSPDNRVTVEPNGQIRLSYTFGDLSAHDRLVRKLHNGLGSFVAHHHTLSGHHFAVDELLPLYGTAHQCGTLRYGTDPKTSVLDTNCKAHEVDNLYAVDASFFCSSSAVNPTLTIVANALRVAAHLRERLG